MSKDKKTADQRPDASKKADRKDKAMPEEIGGREGPEPTRYGDWENKGIASDF